MAGVKGFFVKPYLIESVRRLGYEELNKASSFPSQLADNFETGLAFMPYTSIADTLSGK